MSGDTTAGGHAIPRPIIGWPLQKLIVLDESDPGVLRRMHLLGSPVRRQAIYSVLASLDLAHPQSLSRKFASLTDPVHASSSPLRLISHVLLESCVRDLLVAAHGPVPGLYGALSRCGSLPLRPSDYTALLRLLSGPQDAQHAKVISCLDRIGSAVLEVLQVLEPPFVVHQVVTGLKDRRQAEQFMQGIGLLRCVAPQITDQQLLQSLTSARGDSRLGIWMRRWLLRASRFPIDLPPLPDEFAVLDTAGKLIEAGRRFSNCLGERVLNSVFGRTLYLEHRDTRTIVELMTLDRGRFLLDGIYGPANSSPASDVIRSIANKLASVGVLLPAHLAQVCRWNTVANFVGAVFWNDNIDLDNDEAGEDLPASDELERAA